MATPAPGGLGVGAIVGIAVGALVCCVLCVLLVWCVWRRVNSDDDDEDSDDEGESNRVAHKRQQDQTVEADERVDDMDKKKKRGTTSINAPSPDYVMTFD
jgi:hypothetical protein